MVLVACEESQEVCLAFRKLGAEAYSCDLVKCSGGHPEWHIVMDAAQVVKGASTFPLQNGDEVLVSGHWSLIVAHPPCTMLTHSSAVVRSKGLHSEEQIEEARSFFLEMLNAPAPHVAVENPAPMKDIGLPRYSQIIQPYMVGEPYSKRICLWLRNLPPLFPTLGYCSEHSPWLEHCSSRPGRRARTFSKVAQVIAENWIPFAED